jgi:hypothetical protein
MAGSNSAKKIVAKNGGKQNLPHDHSLISTMTEIRHHGTEAGGGTSTQSLPQWNIIMCSTINDMRY